MGKLLKVHDLSIHYRVAEGELSAVDHISFNVEEKEIFALIGESGCGKSTTAYGIINLFTGSNHRMSGEIEFDGKSILGLSNNEMAEFRGRQIGMIFQNPLDSLNPVYTVGTQMAEALLIDKIDKKAAYSRALEIMGDVRIPDPEKRLSSFPHELSGGMRQRVMIGMMISRNPKLIIADEPTTALDVTVEAQVLDVIKQMRDKIGTAVLLITHNLGIVAEVADRLAVMYAGKIVEKGSVYQIFKNPSHPYTKLLLKAIPSIRKSEGRLSTIEGVVPKLVGEITGCRFAGRCPEAFDLCFEKTPGDYEIGEGHFCACHKMKGTADE